MVGACTAPACCQTDASTFPVQLQYKMSESHAAKGKDCGGVPGQFEVPWQYHCSTIAVQRLNTSIHVCSTSTVQAQFQIGASTSPVQYLYIASAMSVGHLQTTSKVPVQCAALVTTARAHDWQHQAWQQCSIRPATFCRGSLFGGCPFALFQTDTAATPEGARLLVPMFEEMLRDGVKGAIDFALHLEDRAAPERCQRRPNIHRAAP